MKETTTNGTIPPPIALNLLPTLQIKMDGIPYFLTAHPIPIICCSSYRLDMQDRVRRFSRLRILIFWYPLKSGYKSLHLLMLFPIYLPYELIENFRSLFYLTQALNPPCPHIRRAHVESPYSKRGTLYTDRHRWRYW